MSSSPLTDWELWGCAAEVLRQHGANAPLHVAERIGALALAGDTDGLETWKAIASRVSKLMPSDATSQAH